MPPIFCTWHTWLFYVVLQCSPALPYTAMRMLDSNPEKCHGSLVHQLPRSSEMHSRSWCRKDNATKCNKPLKWSADEYKILDVWPGCGNLRQRPCISCGMSSRFPNDPLHGHGSATRKSRDCDGLCISAGSPINAFKIF